MRASREGEPAHVQVPAISWPATTGEGQGVGAVRAPVTSRRGPGAKPRAAVGRLACTPQPWLPRPRALALQICGALHSPFPAALSPIPVPREGLDPRPPRHPHERRRRVGTPGLHEAFRPPWSPAFAWSANGAQGGSAVAMRGETAGQRLLRASTTRRAGSCFFGCGWSGDRCAGARRRLARQVRREGRGVRMPRCRDAHAARARPACRDDPRGVDQARRITLVALSSRSAGLPCAWARRSGTVHVPGSPITTPEWRHGAQPGFRAVARRRFPGCRSGQGRPGEACAELPDRPSGRGMFYGRTPPATFSNAWAPASNPALTVVLADLPEASPRARSRAVGPGVLP